MKSAYEKLEKKLSYTTEPIWPKFPKKEIYDFAGNYIEFISKVKTERQAFREIQKTALTQNFKPLREDSPLTPGSKYFIPNFKKSIALIIIGKQPLTHGANIIVSHSDSPRLDLKQKPVYEDADMVYFKTHYYGGIKRWHWVNVPLALHGIICTKDKDVEISIGEKHTDPVFTIPDLLPHLDKKQPDKQVKDLVPGESLNILVGSYPVHDEKVKEKVKLALLEQLHKEYGISEVDFISAELCAVPAGPARDVGFDKSLVGGYGHDDKACVYTSLRAVLETKDPERTVIAFFMDKEEIGSTGATGSDSEFFENVVSALSVEPRTVLRNSKVLSADVEAGLDPTYKESFDAKNSHFIGHGVSLSKFTGYGGKFSSSDASAEYVRYIIDILDKNNIPWQMGELGKVDEGGGGTIAMYISRYGCDTIDAGVPVLSMHSPFEVISKADLYAAYKFYKVFLK